MDYSAISQLLEAVDDKYKVNIGLETKRLRRWCCSMPALNLAIGPNEGQTPSKGKVFSNEVRF